MLVNQNAQKHVHFIGICGVTMAPLAMLYKNIGWKVTGSDKAFFPPMSAYLEKNGIEIMPGFKARHLDPIPDFVVAMAFITEKNPEVISARRLGVPVKVYADVLPELIERENSIIVAGDCGKTSTTALIVWILECAGFNPNFMIGGIAKNFEHGIRQTNSDWSIIEGDEYPISSWDNTPRFLSYSPKYAVLTNAHWDHMDKFTSEEKYVNAFRALIAKVPLIGAIIANSEGVNVKKIVENSKTPVLFYGKDSFKSYRNPFKGKIWRYNSAAAITLAKHLGIDDMTIRRALNTFVGLKRRQEVRFKERDVIVIDDNAHTPVKVAGGLEAISKMFPRYKLCVIYEPGNRSKAALADEGYKNCFRLAKKIILPRMSAVSEEVRNFNKKLAISLDRSYGDCMYIEDDTEVILSIKDFTQNCRKQKQKMAIVFMSQKGFRGMIEETIKQLKTEK